MGGHFLIETGEEQRRLAGVGAAAEFLAEHGLVDHEVEPEWHLRWCLERMAPGDVIDVGSARVART